MASQRKFGHRGHNPVAKTSREGRHFNAVMDAFVRGELRYDSGKKVTTIPEAVKYAEKHESKKAQRRPGTVAADFNPRRLHVGVKELTQTEHDERRNRAEVKPQHRAGKVRIWPLP